MIIDGQQTAEAIIGELGRRLGRRRVQLELTQAEVAKRAGISKRTLERIEAGRDTQLSSFLRLLRVLELAEGMEQVAPELKYSPVQMAKLRGAERKRVSRKAAKPTRDSWRWGDER